ncbi:unnamed protein product [Callosobruchus maculatus]|uniref:Uncharacterized protein n=1 Tax=Callosobruchus maculatus TaxID=64391 RepID=A0A653BYX0_CALMS|nr:unnamed protein product [Callosobruchus maculatus]
MPAKLLMQKIWISKTGWDDKLPDDLGGIWEEFSQNVSIIKFMAIPRWIFFEKQIKEVQIHVFLELMKKYLQYCH